MSLLLWWSGTPATPPAVVPVTRSVTVSATIQRPRSVAKAAAALMVLAGAATPQDINVPVAGLTLQALAPTVQVTTDGGFFQILPRRKGPRTEWRTVRSVSWAALTAPTGNRSISIPVAGLTLQAFAPTVPAVPDLLIPPRWAVQTVTRQKPARLSPRWLLAITSGVNQNIAVPVASLTLTAHAPQLVGGQPVRTNVGAGSAKRKRRYFVDIDGQRFDVASEAEAVALLEQAKALASTAAERAAAEVVQRRMPQARSLGRVAPVTLSPRIRTNAPQTAELRELRSAIQAIYDEAARTAELQLLMERQAAEEDEQDIADLIAIGAL